VSVTRASTPRSESVTSSIDRNLSSCVSPGVWATKVPFPSFLAYSLSYSIRTDTGAIVVDLGWDSDDSWEAFLLGLGRAELELDDVVGVVVTHVHPDHVGLAARVRKHGNAWIAGHHAEQANILRTATERQRRVEHIVGWLHECGVPAEHADELTKDTVALSDAFPPIEFDFTLTHGELVPDSDGQLRALHTPGHTPGHLCYAAEKQKLYFAGDHLLPRVTPNVSRRPGSLPNPLGTYLSSIADTGSLGDDVLVLPGHEWPFDRASHRASVIEAHVRERTREIVGVLDEGPKNAWDIAVRLSWSRPFELLNIRGKRQALGETQAHLHDLATRNAISRVSNSDLRWHLNETPARLTRSGDAG